MDTVMFVEGNLTRDPEVRHTTTGKAVTRFGVASNRSWFDQASNERREETSFFDVECWGDLGENAKDSLSKGDRAIFVGRPKQDNWETETGEKRSKVILVATGIGTSLRWATAKPTKTTRSNSNGSVPATVGAPADVPADEEPF